MRARRTPPWAVRVRLDPIPLQGSRRWPTCHPQRSSLPGASTHAKRVRLVVTRRSGTTRASGACPTWGLSTWGVRVLAGSRRRRMPAPRVARTGARPAPIWGHRAVRTRRACVLGRSGSGARPAGPTGRRVGTAGAPTGAGCPVRGARRGVQLGGTKAQARRDGACRTWAVAEVAGAGAAEELADGPC